MILRFRLRADVLSKGQEKKGSESSLAFAHSTLADVLNSRGVYGEAMNHAKEATALDPSDALAFDYLAQALSGLRRFYEAVTAAQEAIRLSDGKYSSMHFHLGSAYFDLENWALAEQSFQKAAEINPADAPSAYNVALCFQHQGYLLDAAKWFEEYLRRKPDTADRQDIEQRIRRLRGY